MLFDKLARFLGQHTGFVVLVGLIVAASSPRAAAQYTWTQPLTGTTGNWSTGPWSPGVPTSGTTTVLNFNVLAGSSAYTFTNDIGAFTVNGLNLNNFSTNDLTLDLGANPLTFDGATPFLANNGPGNVTISGTGGIVLNADTAINGSGNGTFSIDAIISGTGGLNINQSGLGITSLTAANSFSGGVTLNSGFINVGNATALGTGTLTINGGSLRGSVTFANAIIANATLDYTGTAASTINGIISGSGGVTTSGLAALTLQGANTYSGPTTIQAFVPIATLPGPSLILSGLNGAIASSNANPITVGKNATLQIIEASGLQNANRIPDAAPIRLDGGRFSYTGAAGSTETIGNLTISGHIRLNATPTGTSTLTAGTLTREDNATAVIGYNSGTFGNIVSASNFTKLTFSGGIPISAVGTGTGTQIGIVPWMLAGTSTTNPRDLVTYDATNGLQVIPFSNATFIAQIASPAGFTSAAVTNQNVHLNGSGTVDLGGGTVVVNSLTSNTSTITFTNGTLTVASGMLVNWDNVAWTTATLDFGPATGYIHVSWGQAFKGTSSITGSGGVVIAGEGSTGNNVTSFENSTGNPFTGGLFVNGNAALGFTADNQLGAAGGTVTFGGGRLAYNLAADLAVNRNIKLGPSGGGITFNVSATGAGAATGTAGASTVVTLGGVISGSGTFFKEGTGVAKLTGTNTYGGGTVVTAGALQFTNDANLGTAGTRITLNGGNLQPLADGTLNRPIDVLTNSTITTDFATTLAASVRSTGQVYTGTANPILTKAGTGTLTIAASNPNFSGTLAIMEGSVDVTGSLPQISTITVGLARFLIDNSAAYTANKIGDLSAITLASGFASYIAPPTATVGTAEQFGPLNVTSAGSVFSVTGSSASPTVIRFSNLNLTGGNLTLRGDGLGDTVGNYTRIYFDTAPVLSGSIIPNVFYAATAGSGTSTIFAQWDSVLGVIPFTPIPISGSIIDNFAPTSTPLAADFTTNATATAKTGATIYRLTLDAGTGLTLTGGNPADPINANTPDGTLAISSGLLSTTSTSAKTIDSDAARTLTFGTAAATITTASDLTFTPNVTLGGTGGLTKAGTGTLALNGPYAVTGPLTVSAGTIAFGTSASVGDLSGVGTIALGANALTIDQAADSTFAGTLTGGTTLTKNGPGTLTFAPSNTPTYAGGTTIGSGTLKLGSVGGFAAIFTGGVAFGSAANTSGILDLNGFSVPGDITAVPPVIGTGTGHQIINSNSSTASNLTLNLPGDTIAPFAFGGNLIVDKNDPFTLTLVGTVQPPATTTGVIHVNAGILVVTSGTPVSPGMSFTVATGAAMNFGAFGNNNTDAGAFGSLTVNGGTAVVAGGSGDLGVKTVNLTGGTLDFSGTTNFWWHMRNAGASINTFASGTTTTFIGVTSGSRIQNDTSAPPGDQRRPGDNGERDRSRQRNRDEWRRGERELRQSRRRRHATEQHE
ncbi:MAG TPA: autotransporter-associated beta strand repeat-containing protein [Fimbriiglobus sp.]